MLKGTWVIFEMENEKGVGKSIIMKLNLNLEAYFCSTSIIICDLISKFQRQISHLKFKIFNTKGFYVGISLETDVVSKFGCPCIVHTRLALQVKKNMDMSPRTLSNLPCIIAEGKTFKQIKEKSLWCLENKSLKIGWDENFSWISDCTARVLLI